MRKPVYKATCTGPAQALSDGGGTGLLRVARGRGSVRIASIALAPGQAPTTAAFTLERPKGVASAFVFRARPLDGPTRTVRQTVRILVRFATVARRTKTLVV